MTFPNSSVATAGKYDQIRLIGRGSGGNVYFATDNLWRRVAVKETLPSQAGFIDTLDRFQKEARLHAILSHPNIIQVYHLDEDPQTQALYLICEYADGGSLADYLDANGPLPEEQAIHITLDICAALEEVWNQRIVHRDIKPANILLFKDDRGYIMRAKLGDFGVAKDLDRRRAGQPTTQRGSSHPGTPEYMAPEQANITRPVDVRTDLYALGICLWEMLTGTDYKLVAASGPPDLRAARPQASPAIAEVIRRAVQDAPADRYQTPQAMASDLQRALAGQVPPATPTTRLKPAPTARPRQLAWVWIVLLALLLLALGGYWFWPRTPTQWVYAREGESADRSTVGTPIQRSGASGGWVYGQFGSAGAEPWPAQPGSVTYANMTLLAVDHLLLQVQYSKNTPASVPILVYLDDEPSPRAIFNLIDQGSWDMFALTEPIDLGQIATGAHSITFFTDGQQFGVADIDKFVLTAGPAPKP
jgi:serine/threonine protein kinase